MAEYISGANGAASPQTVSIFPPGTGGGIGPKGVVIKTITAAVRCATTSANGSNYSIQIGDNALNNIVWEHWGSFPSATAVGVRSAVTLDFGDGLHIRDGILTKTGAYYDAGNGLDVRLTTALDSTVATNLHVLTVAYDLC